MNALEILWNSGLKLAEISQKLYEYIGNLEPLNLLAILASGVSGWLSLLFLRR